MFATAMHNSGKMTLKSASKRHLRASSHHKVMIFYKPWLLFGIPSAVVESSRRDWIKSRDLDGPSIHDFLQPHPRINPTYSAFLLMYYSNTLGMIFKVRDVAPITKTISPSHQCSKERKENQGTLLLHRSRKVASPPFLSSSHQTRRQGGENRKSAFNPPGKIV